MIKDFEEYAIFLICDLHVNPKLLKDNVDGLRNEKS